MKELDFTFKTRIDFDRPVREHYFVLRMLPRTSAGEVKLVGAHCTVDPFASLDRQQDAFGNALRSGCIRDEHTHIEYSSSGTVQVDLSARHPAKAHPLFRYPSALTKPSEELAAFAREFGAAHPQMDGAACTDLAHAVHEALTYVAGSTGVHTTAAQAFAAGRGVCQDFSHVMVACLRELGTPARYVSGLTLGGGQTHAWVEASLDGLWVAFDPTFDRQVDETYIPLACGRDWSDCPIENGSFVGVALQRQAVSIQVSEHTR